jgi:ribosomal protein L29
MVLLRSKDIIKMDEKERTNKLKDLRMELVKANVAANKTNSKTKEIKRAIARLITFDAKGHKGPQEASKNKS